MTSGKEHAEQARERLHASDYQWQNAAAQADSLEWALGSLREVMVAQVHATLANAKATNSIRWWLDQHTDYNYLDEPGAA